MRLLGRPYSFGTIVRLAARAVQGFWKDQRPDLEPARRAVICSQVFADAFAATHLRTPGEPAIPAKLSATGLLEDVEIAWRRIA